MMVVSHFMVCLLPKQKGKSLSSIEAVRVTLVREG